MEFKFERDFGKGKRRIIMVLGNVELERLSPALQQKLLEAERSSSPVAMLGAWTALLDPAMGALQLTLLGEGPDEAEDGEDNGEENGEHNGEEEEQAAERPARRRGRGWRTPTTD